MQLIPPLAVGAKARCPRCGETVAVNASDPFDRPLALTLAAAIVYGVANTMPLMGLTAVGRKASTTILLGAREMWQQESQITAVIVAFCAVIAPAIYIALLLTILIAVRRPLAPRWVGRLLRWVELVRPWSMNEVMMLGVLVALTKIAQLATVTPGIGMYAVGVLVVLLAAISSTFDPGAMWERIKWANSAEGVKDPVRTDTDTSSGARAMR